MNYLTKRYVQKCFIEDNRIDLRLPTAARSLKIEEQIPFFYEIAWCIITLITNLKQFYLPPGELKFNRIVMTSFLLH